MKLLEILQKELTEFPKGMLYAVQDGDGEVKFGKHSRPVLWDEVWQRREDGKNLTIPRLELAEDWDSAIVTKDMWENYRVKQIIVNVSDLTIKEKLHVNEALAKVTGSTKLPVLHSEAVWFYAPDSLGRNMAVVGGNPHETPTHTPQQVLEMAGMVNQGHVHAELMAQYAEDAKTSKTPWELWEYLDKDDGWTTFKGSPGWYATSEYRRKPKTHIVNGVEIPDLRITPKYDEYYYLADPTEIEFTYLYLFQDGDPQYNLWSKRGLAYQYTEEGKQAAILHAKAMLGII